MALDKSHQAVPREARISPHGTGGVSYPAEHDPDHRRAWEAVSGGSDDWAEVRSVPDGTILFRAWRISQESWAWQTPVMPVPAFARYGDGI